MNALLKFSKYHKYMIIHKTRFLSVAQMPEDVKPLQELYMLTQACVLLLVLKQHLKDMYGFTDA